MFSDQLLDFQVGRRLALVVIGVIALAGLLAVTAEREELARLRKENRLLKTERVLLKKWAAFFAKETT